MFMRELGVRLDCAVTLSIRLTSDVHFIYAAGHSGILERDSAIPWKRCAHRPTMGARAKAAGAPPFRGAQGRGYCLPSGAGELGAATGHERQSGYPGAGTEAYARFFSNAD